jgi:uncharacterized membrane protein
MMALSILGLCVIGGLVAFGIWFITSRVTTKQVTERYKYVKTQDAYGNDITKVIDLHDSEAE